MIYISGKTVVLVGALVGEKEQGSCCGVASSVGWQFAQINHTYPNLFLETNCLRSRVYICLRKNAFGSMRYVSEKEHSGNNRSMLTQCAGSRIALHLLVMLRVLLACVHKSKKTHLCNMFATLEKHSGNGLGWCDADVGILISSIFELFPRA